MLIAGNSARSALAAIGLVGRNGEGPHASATITVSDFAGTGTAGYSGEGGAATNAQLNQPQDVTTDEIGSVYIFDSQNRTIRKVDTNGTIKPVSGNGPSGPYCSTTNLTNAWGDDDSASAQTRPRGSLALEVAG